MLAVCVFADEFSVLATEVCGRQLISFVSCPGVPGASFIYTCKRLFRDRAPGSVFGNMFTEKRSMTDRPDSLSLGEAVPGRSPVSAERRSAFRLPLHRTQITQCKTPNEKGVAESSVCVETLSLSSLVSVSG